MDGLAYNASLRAAALLAVGMLAILLGGCGDDDKGGKSRSGGGSSVYPSIPTVLPTLVGLPVAIDTSGGTSTGAAGGSGGDITVWASAGRIVLDDGRSRPAINNNFLTPTVLANSSVTYAELIAIQPGRVSVAGGTAWVDLIGEDFHLPAGATLDISDAPIAVDQVVIRTNLAGDFIRIDGNVNGVRLTLDSVGLGLLSEQATGNAISIDGNVDLRGYSSPVTYDGGELTLIAYHGAVILAGTVNTTGNSPGAAAGGTGGNVTLLSDAGDIILPDGMIQANGGGGTLGGAAGDSGFSASSAVMMRFAWSVRANGGAGTGANQGGDGGDVSVDCDGPLDMFMATEALGGATGTGDGGQGGDVSVRGLTSQGAVVSSSNGGAGGLGGDGGNGVFEGESVFGVAVQFTAHGGTGSVQGGSGGSLQLYADGAECVNVLATFMARGGNSAGQGGQGGDSVYESYGETLNLTLTGDVSGGTGTGTSGNGGDGGECVARMWSRFGEAITASTFNFTANGGGGANMGGGGGNLTVDLSASDRNAMTVSFSGVGGAGGADLGGTGGSADFGMGTGVSLVADLDINVSGGGTTSGNGAGTGGDFSLNSAGISTIALSGNVTARGGTNSGLGGGGTGGTASVFAAFWAVLSFDTMVFDLRGGDSASGRGGNGAGTSFDLGVGGQVTFTNGSILASGGAGSATSGTTGGGNGGGVSIVTQFGHLLMGADIDVSGGNGSTQGAGSAAGQVDIACQTADLQITGDIVADGRTGLSAGPAGDINIAGDGTTRMVITSLLSANGGGSTSVAGPVGAAGGNIDIGGGFEFSVRFASTAIVRANGGTPNGAAGLIDIDLAGTGISGITEDAGSLLQTNTGNGTPVPANIDRNTN
ncbi:MAG: hypothetical protein IT464_14060 [Planctomycetes bacterium]|nr:hypothetical protein [Planctomycetota bacterium]